MSLQHPHNFILYGCCINENFEEKEDKLMLFYILSVKLVEQTAPQSTISTPSTISPAPDSNPDEDYSKSSALSNDYDRIDDARNKEYMRYRILCIMHVT